MTRRCVLAKVIYTHRDGLTYRTYLCYAPDFLSQMAVRLLRTWSVGKKGCDSGWVVVEASAL